MSLHTEKPGIKTTGVAGAAITKRRFIGYDDKVCSTIGQKAKGVSGEDDQDINKTFAITIDGTALVEAGEALAVETEVTTNALGKAILATAGHHINGIVMRAQSVIGQLVEIRLMTGGVSVADTTTTTTTTTGL